MSHNLDSCICSAFRLQDISEVHDCFDTVVDATGLCIAACNWRVDTAVGPALSREMMRSVTASMGNKDRDVDCT